MDILNEWYQYKLRLNKKIMKQTVSTISNSANDYFREVKHVPSEEENEKQISRNEVKKSATWFLTFVIITGIRVGAVVLAGDKIRLTPMLVGGTSMVWSSSAIVKLQSNDSNINPLGKPLTTADISKILGIPGLLGLLGCSLLPKLADFIGRKRCFHVISSVMFLSIVGLAFSYQIEFILTCLSIIAICFQGMVVVFPIYLIEICEEDYRAKYCTLMSVSFPVGQLYSYVIGPMLSLRNFTLLSAAPMIPFLLLFFFVPESPTYSLRKGKKEECLKALQKLRKYNNINELEPDFKKIEDTLSISNQNNASSIMKLFCTKEGRVGLMLGFLPVVVQNFSGVKIFLSLMAPIFNDSGSIISGSTIAICVGVVKVFSYSFTSLVIERFGNRPLLILSSAFAGFPISMLGVYFYLQYINSPLLPHLQWLPLVCVLLYFVGYSLGIGPIPDSLNTILFNSDLRSVAGAFIVTTVGVAFAGYQAIFPLLSEAVGNHWCMWMFGVTCFLGAILFYIIMPETKGKTILEIQEVLKSH